MTDNAAVEKCIRRAHKIAAKRYPELDLDTCPLNGPILMRTIQYMMFAFIYQVNNDEDPSSPEQLAHWMTLYQAYKHFMPRWNRLVARVQNHVRAEILARTHNDPEHPLVFLYDSLVERQELHIRRPKISPTRKTRNAARCYNSVNNSVCDFQASKGRRPAFGMFVFTPLPSDDDYMVRDPNERSEQYRLYLMAEKLKNNTPSGYDASDQFCAIVTPAWCKLGRLLHNIFHLQDYINVDIVQEIYDNNVERLRTQPWPKVWGSLVGEKFAALPIESFHKGKTHPQTVVSISQIYNIVTAAIKLDPQMKK